MKRSFSFFLISAFILLLFILLLNGLKTSKKFADRISLRKQDRIPYGTSAANSLLPSMFPQATISYSRGFPGTGGGVDMEGSGQAVILVADYFDAGEEELYKLLNFTRKGNFVFLIARSFSSDAADFFNISPIFIPAASQEEDSLKIRLEHLIFQNDSLFSYPGRKHAYSFSSLDSARTLVLGKDEDNRANFLRLSSGSGHFFIHTAPLAFSNYFVLHKQNVKYLQAVFSVIPASIDKINWNEYYLNKPQQQGSNNPNWLRVLLSYESFRWSFYTAVFTLGLFLVLNMRRRQRSIAAHQRPVNESLDFIRTIGRLYYDKGDHKNLAEKMAAYFLEYIRTTYKLTTHSLDDQFLQMLHLKTGQQVEDLNWLTSYIKGLKTATQVTEPELHQFYNRLQLFYQKA